MKVEKRAVKFKEGKFAGEVMTINASDFNRALHEDASAPASEAKGKGAKSEEKSEAKGKGAK